jgi:hypothetical protein
MERGTCSTGATAAGIRAATRRRRAASRALRAVAAYAASLALQQRRNSRVRCWATQCLLHSMPVRLTIRVPVASSNRGYPSLPVTPAAAATSTDAAGDENREGCRGMALRLEGGAYMPYAACGMVLPPRRLASAWRMEAEAARGRRAVLACYRAADVRRHRGAA